MGALCSQPYLDGYDDVHHPTANGTVTILNEPDEPPSQVGSLESLVPGRSPTLGLTLGEINVIKRTWSDLSCDAYKLGERIFLRIFQTNPHLKESFLFSELQTDLLYLEPRFVKHANNFTHFLKAVVEKLDEDEQSVLEAAKPIAIVHAKRARFDPLMFDPENWFSFVSAAVTEISLMWGEKNHRSQRKFSGNLFKAGISRREVRSSWRLFLLRVILEMKVEFYKELLRTARRSSRIRSVAGGSSSLTRLVKQSSAPQTPINLILDKRATFGKSKSSASFTRYYTSVDIV